MRPLGTIFGRALDTNGEPLAGARVDAMAFRPDDYFRVLTPIAGVDTDDRGDFRISALDPDDYYIRVSPPAGTTFQKSYPTTYYPNTTEPSTAAKIVVAAGSEIAGIDPRLPSRGVTLSGQIVRPNEDSSIAILFLMLRSPSVFVLPSDSPNQIDQTKDDFELRGIPPGSYYLYVITRPELPEKPEWVRFPLDVGDKDIENLALPITPASSIKGRITFASDAGDTEKVDLSRIALDAGAVEWVPGSPRNGARAQVARNGEFQFAHLSEMRLFLRNQNLPDKWFLSSVRLDGSDVMTTGFSATPGKESVLEVVISNAGGTLAGIIKDPHDKPVPAGRLVLLPEVSRRSNPFLVRTGVAIERGEFTIETIPPGEYTAIAFPDEDQFTPAFLRDLQTVEKYERFGQRVHIGARETTRLDLTVAIAEPK
jgi:hypothetical protein